MAIIIDGKKTAQDIREELKIKVDKMKAEKGITPGLALLLVGEDAASKVYVNSKDKACKEVGIYSIILRKDKDTSEEEILQTVAEWNKEDSINGILVQLPLPKHIDENKVILSIDPRKDVDGFHPENFGRLVIGLPGFVSCTPAGILELLKRYKIDMKGKHVVVAGRSNIVGKPIANLLYQKKDYANSIVTICHTGSKDNSKYYRDADVIIAAMGVPEIIKAKDLKEGVVVIDVGINRVDAPERPRGYRLTGDVAFEEVEKIASAITPVPGGVGPMTIAMLLSNTVKSANGEVY
jgi:methylenetetrahydrofolate dehydrogenase (NADP+) / methenyltetrahydrofolate cyclohydrolase